MPEFNKDFFEGIAAAIFNKEFFIGVATAIVLAFLTWLVRLVGRSAYLLVVSSKGDFKISGYWVTSCKMSDQTKPPHMEIWRYWVRGSSVRLVFYVYHADGSRITKQIGRGLLRGKQQVAAYYFDPDSELFETGVATFQTGQRTLEGAFMQFDMDREGKPLHKSDYIQRRAKGLSLIAKVRMAFGFRPLRAYADVKAIHELNFANPAG